MNTIHIVPGLEDSTCGIAVAAKMVARRQVANGKSVECVDFKAWTWRQIAVVDEVWVHSMWTPGVMKAAWAALRMGRTLVRMPHGCMDPVKRRHRWWKKMWVTPIERWLFGKADRVVATCDDEVEWIKEFAPKVKKVEMFSLGDGFSDKPLEAVHNPLRLLFVGRLHPLKGVEFLLGAMKDFLTRISQPKVVRKADALAGVRCRDAETQSLELRIIGKDEGEGDKLRQMAKDYGLNVEFCGVVSEEEKEKAWDWCDVLVLPTLSENFGLVVAEALERGKRVITTDGAPAWESLAVSGQQLAVSDPRLAVSGQELGVSGDGCGIGVGCGGRLLYLKGFRDGTKDERVRLLKEAILVVSC